LVRLDHAVRHRNAQVALGLQDGEPQPTLGPYPLLRRPYSHEFRGRVPGGEDVRDRRLTHAAYSAVRSTMAVTPCPPAAQIEMSPRPLPFSASSLARVARIRPPVAAKGCPTASDEPTTFNRS